MSAATAPTRPIALPPLPENIPDELKARKQWLAWRYEWRDGRWTKAPYSAVTGRKASTTDPTTWATIDLAMAYYEKAGLDGIGFVFIKGDPYTGSDLDHAYDPASGHWDSTAAEVIGRLDSYAEASPSGTGAHVIVRATLRQPGHRTAIGDSGAGIELYDDRRFFTMTGRHLLATPTTIEDRQDVIDELQAELFGTPSTKETAPQTSTPPPFDDDQIIAKCMNDQGGVTFRQLWNGQHQGLGLRDTSPSGLLWALRNHILYYTRDLEQVRRICDHSALVSPKWDEKRGDETWFDYDTRRALEQKRGAYDGSCPTHDGASCELTDPENDGTPFCPRCTQLEARIDQLEAELREQRELNQLMKRLVHSPAMKGKRAAVALAFVDEVRDQRRKGALAGDEVEIPNAWIAKRAGCSTDQAGTYLREFASAECLKRRVEGTREERVNPKNGEIKTTTINHALVTIPAEPPTEILQKFIAFTSAKADAHGGRREPRCPEHPNAPVTRTTTTTCSVCHLVLDVTERQHEHGELVPEFLPPHYDFTDNPVFLDAPPLESEKGKLPLPTMDTGLRGTPELPGNNTPTCPLADEGLVLSDKGMMPFALEANVGAPQGTAPEPAMSDVEAWAAAHGWTVTDEDRADQEDLIRVLGAIRVREAITSTRNSHSTESLGSWASGPPREDLAVRAEKLSAECCDRRL